MSLQAEPIPEIPAETMRVARAVFRKGNVYMKMRDELGTLYSDTDLADLFPAMGQPALAAWQLALVSVMQFAENLTDRQTAEAMRSRIDWKYALSLELTDAGFDFSVLSEFRDRLLDVMLSTFKTRGWLKAGGRQRTDATYVKAAIHKLNRVELVAAVFQEALEALAVTAPDWLHSRTPLEAVVNLRLVWSQQYDLSGVLPRFLDEKELLDSAERQASPHDTQARFRYKRDLSWVGYQAHFTETCDEDSPHLIIHIETTPATTSDYGVLPDIHADLRQQDMLPAEHLVDGGYSSSDVLTDSPHDFGVTIFGTPMITKFCVGAFTFCGFPLHSQKATFCCLIRCT
jgi:transposase